MTWFNDAQQNKPSVDAGLKLIAQRAVMVDQLKAMRDTMPTFRSNAAKEGYAEDMAKLAKKINAIDKKLGRT